MDLRGIADTRRNADTGRNIDERMFPSANVDALVGEFLEAGYFGVDITG